MWGRVEDQEVLVKENQPVLSAGGKGQTQRGGRAEAEQE